MPGAEAQKETLLARAFEETRRGRELLMKRDIEGFQASVAARQALFDEIDRLDATRKAPVNTQRELAMIGNMIELDKEIAGLAKEARLGLERDMRDVGSGKRLLAYGGAVRAGGMFVNKKG